MSGIYIHIPFCRSKCIYCDFYSVPSGRNQSIYSDFVDSIIGEYESRKAEYQPDKVKTLYIGGGTPSTLPQAELTRLLDYFCNPSIEEITIEVNPEDINDTLLEILVNHGVNRLSMGIQSFNNTVLKFIGRRHSDSDINVAVNRIHQAGITNISGDLIFGLPGDTLTGWQYSVDRFVEMGLPHLSAYLLSYEPRTRLTAMRNRGKIEEATEELITSMYEYLTERTAQCGYEHYEISNYSKPGFHSRHNSSYWNGTVYLGLGPGAHSYNGTTRSYNPSSLKQYLECMGTGFNVVEPPNEDDSINDIIITAMRTARGLRLDRLPQADVNRILRDAKPHFNNGTLCKSTDNRIYIPERYFLISDSIIVDLIR